MSDSTQSHHRALASLLAMIMLITAPDLAHAPRVAAAGEAIVVVSSQLWTSELGWLHVVGEVRNESTDWAAASVGAVFYDDTGGVVATGVGYPVFPLLPPGSSTGFDFIMNPPPVAFDSYAVVVGPLASYRLPIGALSIRFGSTTVDSDGALHVTGYMTNASAYQIANPGPIVLLRDSNGDIMLIGGGHVSGFWPPGANVPFDVMIPEHWSGFASVSLQASARISDQLGEGAVYSWDIYLADIGSTQFRGDIIWIANHDITVGCGRTAFCPLEPVTREQMASFLVRGFDLRPSAMDYYYDDADSKHQADINALAAAGITRGCGFMTFCPSGLVTREQMASFIARALDLPESSDDFFADDDDSPHESDINRLALAGITHGCGAGDFCPLEGVTRGQMAAFLRRALSE